MNPDMALRAHLPTGCKFVAADLNQWLPEVRYVDVDADIFPDVTVDYVTLLGVIEYLEKPWLAFDFARRCAAAVVVSYSHPLTSDTEPRNGSGWVNTFTVDDFRELASKSGLRIACSDTFHLSKQTHQMIHLLLRND